MMNYFGYGSYGPGFFLGPIFMVFFWVIIIALIVSMVSRMSGKGSSCCGHGGSDALEILKERYAKGEIDKKEFEAKKKDLEN